jgi:hypothetical protein
VWKRCCVVWVKGKGRKEGNGIACMYGVVGTILSVVIFISLPANAVNHVQTGETVILFAFANESLHMQHNVLVML